jgi:biopolymer transport protein ExbD
MLATRIVGALKSNGASGGDGSRPPKYPADAMKKCSHSAHHSLTELNITPLLDLAFVLLVIFIITTTPIVNDLDLNLPAASKHQKDPPRKANYITVQADGKLWINKAPVTSPDCRQSWWNCAWTTPI